MSIQIREAQRSDIAFITDSNARMALETENKHLDKAILQKGVEALWADASRGFYLIAELNGRPAGQLMITFEWSDWRNGNFWWIQSVYVAEEARRQGVFRALYACAEQKARAAEHCCGLRLYVEKHNEQARKTYGRMGMYETDYLLYCRDF